MKLNLPQYPLKTSVDPDTGAMKVYDRLRHREVALTPEEEVRQAFVEYLINDLGYPEARMANEVSLKLNGTSRRCDTVVFGADRRPLLIVEYKSPSVKITQRVFDQIVRYNMALHARWLVVSNGLSHYCCEIDLRAGTYRFLPSLPSWPLPRP